MNLNSEETEHLCSSCQPGSDIPHEILSTRFRIANLCCAGEERIIRSSLEEIIGIEDISINIIGRYAIIKHCGVSCCAPAEKIADILNNKQLGASIQEANADDVELPDDPKYFNIFHGLLVLLFFIAALIIDGTVENHAYYFIGYLVCTGVGLIPILYDSIIAIYRKTVDIHILMMVAIIGAIATAEYLDAALVVTLFVLAEVMEGEIMRRVRNAVQLGIGGMPKNAILLNGDSIPVDDLVIGDKIAIRAGDMVLVDGIVSNGNAVIDESALTGEAIPIQKTKGDPVISGTVVQNGYIEVEVTTDPKESTVRKLNDKVSEVQADRGEFAKLVDKFAGGWTPFILFSAISLVLGGGGITGEWNTWLQRALVLLVLACPCAIVIAAPIPSVCTIALAAKHGVLIKGSTVVENLGLVDTLAVDKTGTLTKGFFSVSEKRDVSKVDDDNDDEDDTYLDPIGLAAALESKSSHPLANAIVAAHCGCIAEFSGKLADVKKVSVIDGVGMQGWVQVDDDWKHISVGNERLLKVNGGKIKPSKKMQLVIDEFFNQHEGEIILYITIEDEIKGLISLSDEIRPDAQEMVQRMHNNNFQVAMLTGDHKEVAEEICRTVSIPSHDCYSRLLPNDKLEWIIKKQKETKCDGVMMLGDGINDATALAASRVGVAMGAGGSAMAVVAADVVILSNNLLRIPSSVKLCRIARSTIIQNCSFAIGIKLLAIILAILGMLKLWHAVLIDVGSLLFVVANGSSILLKSYVFDEFKNYNDHHSHENCGHGDHDHSHEHDHSHSNTHDHDHNHDHSHDHSHEHDHEHDHNCNGEIELLGKHNPLHQSPV